jgi:hypothetical protein
LRGDGFRSERGLNGSGHGGPYPLPASDPSPSAFFGCFFDLNRPLTPVDVGDEPVTASEYNSEGSLVLTSDEVAAFDLSDFTESREYGEGVWGGKYGEQFQEMAAAKEGFALLPEPQDASIGKQNVLFREIREEGLDVLVFQTLEGRQSTNPRSPVVFSDSSFLECESHDLLREQMNGLRGWNDWFNEA